MNKTVCELFAGVGGFHLGLSKAGEWQVIWANQWEPNKSRQYAYECYTSHFPETTTLNIDIAKVNDDEENYPIPNHTLLVGGFPCQDYSVASTLAKGIQGKKGVLWWEIQKIIKRKRPPFILLENVDRLLKSPAKQRGRDFGIMLTCLKELGYNVEWRVINAADYGFSQRRRRVFIFAYSKTTKLYNNVTKKISDFGIDDYLINEGFFNKEFKIEEIVKKTNCLLEKDILEISDNFSFDFYEAGILNNNEVVSFKIKPKVTQATKLRDILEENVDEHFYIGNDLEKWNYMKGAKAEPRKSSTGHEYVYREGAVAFPDSLDLPARTMLTSESSRNRSTHVIEDPITKRLRVLTPIECERLNGFDDDWTNTGMTEKFRYFCMGNALVVGLIEIMGKKISEIVDNENNELQEVAITSK
ncbi:DNA (cytosine-5-)-methyltransferase [Clostridium paraputrificum]|uniref:DNA (cytosine-5-)-methyltransferase n=1 Tax=Clostridium paraputrificum TaxID=29363 RepID=UPI000C07109C|nr:DNA (cytosine-5-)-methyltransferase [Clostridium paraputrificum]